jgi:hypothetical protein
LVGWLVVMMVSSFHIFVLVIFYSFHFSPRE